MAITAPNITLWAGKDEELDITLFEENGTTPIDLSGATVRWALSSVYDRDIMLVFKSTATPGGITVTSALGGTVAVSIDAEDTANLGGQPYYQEAEVFISGKTITVMVGPVTINKTIF